MPLDLLHLTFTAALFGLIWTIQLVHYPSFAAVDREQWSEFHRAHSRGITFIVFPLMLGELLISSWRLYSGGLSNFEFAACLIPSIQWGLTAFLFVPLHHRLAKAQDPAKLRKLVSLNWLRTGLWTAELTLLLVAYSTR